MVAAALGEGRRYSPHCLRHTWASLHMARGTPLKWVQEQGGWTTAKLLLDTYGHYMPSESRGFADVLSAAPDGPKTAPRGEHLTSGSSPGPESAEDPGFSEAAVQATSPRSPIMHFERGAG